MKRHHLIAIVSALLVSVTSESTAQLANPSARSFGLAGSFTARARGYEAPFWNPANLGLPNQPGWSIGLAGASAYLNNNSLTYRQITDLYGEFLDDQTKSQLLANIRRNDPDRMLELAFDLGAHAMGVSIGRFAIGLGGIGAGSAQLSPDAAELLLFGNVGEDGTGRDFTLQGSEAQAWATSGGLVSYAQPFSIPALGLLKMNFSAGATVKYGIAHGLVRLSDRGSQLTSDPLGFQMDIEVLTSNGAAAGSFWSLDLGLAMDWGPLTAGMSLQNAIGDISWNGENFELKLVSASADFEGSTSSDTTLVFKDLDPDDQARITEFLAGADVPKRLRLGVAYGVSSMLSVSGDYVELIGGTLRTRWDRTISVGAELALFGAVPLRAGLATDFSDFAYTGGMGVYAGPAHLDFSIGRYGVPGGDGVVGALSISIWPGTRY